MKRTDIEIMKTEFQARRKAKFDFANILNIDPRSVRVAHDKYNELRYGGFGTRCVCGQTTIHYFAMTNASKKQMDVLGEYFNYPFPTLAYGECFNCGTKY